MIHIVRMCNNYTQGDKVHLVHTTYIIIVVQGHNLYISTFYFFTLSVCTFIVIQFVMKNKYAKTS